MFNSHFQNKHQDVLVNRQRTRANKHAPLTSFSLIVQEDFQRNQCLNSSNQKKNN